MVSASPLSLGPLNISPAITEIHTARPRVKARPSSRSLRCEAHAVNSWLRLALLQRGPWRAAQAKERNHAENYPRRASQKICQPTFCSVQRIELWSRNIAVRQSGACPSDVAIGDDNARASLSGSSPIISTISPRADRLCFQTPEDSLLRLGLSKLP